MECCAGRHANRDPTVTPEPTTSCSHLRTPPRPVKATPQDRGVRTRQDFYLRALKTVPNLSIHYGHFPRSMTWMPLAMPKPTSLRCCLNGSHVRPSPSAVSILAIHTMTSSANPPTIPDAPMVAPPRSSMPPTSRINCAENIGGNGRSERRDAMKIQTWNDSSATRGQCA